MTRAGTVAPARLGIAHIADDLHRAARRLRLFAAAPVTPDRRRLLEWVEGSAADVRAAVERR
jgi:hypothetical protein